MKTDLLDAVLKVSGPFDDLDFHSHEIDWKIPAIEFRKSYCVFLSCDEDFRFATHTTIDDVKHFLLGVAVVVSKTALINNLITKTNQALFETFRLSNATDGGQTSMPHPLQRKLFSGKKILKEEWMMHALNDTRLGID